MNGSYSGFIFGLKFVILLLFVQAASAQTDPMASDLSPKTVPIKITGEFGVYSELYSISGRERRRPSSTERLFFNPSLSLNNSLQLDFRFVLSSDGNSSRQDINRMEINPVWSWGEINAGDFSLSYSPFTVSGIKIRGGAFDLSPGKFHLASFGGISQREVSTFDKKQSFKREIFGGLIGFGESSKSHIQLTALKAEDIFNTIEEITIDTTGTSDSLSIDSTAIPNITPKENIVTALKSRLILSGGNFILNTEISGSAYTRDQNASDLNPDDIPSGVGNVFSVKTSSSFDFAYATDAKVRIKRVTLTGKYTYIGPGYVSLGVASLQNDVKLIGGGFTLNQRKYLIRGNADFQKDNLIGQKLYTTDRNRFSLMFNYRATQKWNINNSLNFSTMNNNAASENLLLDYSSLVFRTGHRFTFTEKALRTITVDYTLQKSEDSNPLRTSSKLNSHASSLGLQFALTRNLYISPSVRVLMSKQGDNGRKTTQTYILSGRHFAVQKKLSNSAQLSYSIQEDTKNFRGTLRSKYSFEAYGAIGIEFSYNKLNTDIFNRASFNESFVKFTYSKSF